MTIKKISVFCGAHLGKSSDYKIAAQQIGKMIAERDLEVIFGGGNVGLMKVVADTAIENGGKATGITIKSLHEFELTNPNIDETDSAESNIAPIEQLTEDNKQNIELNTLQTEGTDPKGKAIKNRRGRIIGYEEAEETEVDKVSSIDEAERNFNPETQEHEYSGGDNPVKSKQTVL